MPSERLRLLRDGSSLIVAPLRRSFARCAAIAVALLAVNALSYAQPASSTIDLTFAVRGAAPVPISGTLVLRSATDPALKRELPLTAAAATVSARAGSAWNVVVSARGYWSPESYVVFPAAGERVTRALPLWRTGAIKGSVKRATPNLELPKTLKVYIESPPQPAQKPEIARGTTFECPLAGDGTWTCELPAATLDLAVGQKGFTPTYLWGVKVSAEKPVSVGAILMRRGASFTAWLDRDTMKALKHPARARLVRLVSPEATQMISRLSTPVAEGTFDGRGSVQLAPLPPGVYVLEVVAAGFATTRVPHVEIFEGGESTLRRPIELRPPLEVVVTVEPAAAADGQAWDVELRRENDFVTGAEPVPPIRGRVNAVGELHAPEVEPGTFTVVVRDRAGNRVFNRSYSVQSDAESAIHIKLDQHEVKGTVYLGDSPLKAVIWFGGEQSSERIAMQSDDDGKFSGTLPRRGDWRADVVWGDPTLRAQTDVSVPATGEVVVRLPDNPVRGVVKDERGERLKAGSVMAKQGLRVLVSPVRSDGTFEFRGLAAGTLELFARARGRSTPTVKLALSDGSHFEGVELILDATHDVNGVVSASAQSVIGARISAIPIGSGNQNVASTVSDDRGRFSLALPENTRRALITVAAAGRTLHTFDVPISDAALQLAIAPVGGTLDLSAVRPPMTLTRDGVAIYVNDILNWMGAHGDPLSDLTTMHIPDLAPGRYEVCTVRNGAPKCVAGLLAPGASLALTLPE
jgi:hypothetical protein